MATRRRGVKHTRRRHRHHAKTKKKLSKRYRGKKGYNKRITRRHTRRSHDTDVINTQSGGNLTIWSAAKTAAGKALELKLISRYLLKNANKTINDYVVSKRITLADFYKSIAQPTYHLPPDVRNAVQIYVNVIKLSPNAEHDLPHEILERYNEIFPEDGDSSSANVSFTDTDSSVGNIEHYDETEFKDEKLKIFKSVDGHVSIKAKKILFGKNPESASIDCGDAVTFLGHIFNPSGVPFIMIVVFYTQIDYVFPPLKPEDIQMLLESGVTTTGDSRPGNIIFVRKIVKIDMTKAGEKLCGNLTAVQKVYILGKLKEASRKVKSHIQSEREKGKKICESVDAILTKANALLRVSVKDNRCYTKNRIQARLLVILRQLDGYYEVDDNPEVISPVIGATSSPLVSTSLNMSFSKALDASRQFSERTDPTSFSKDFKPENFAGKSPEEIGIIVMEAMRKDPNFANFLKRIYNTSSGSKKSRPSAPRSTTSASARPSATGASARGAEASSARPSATGASARGKLKPLTLPAPTPRPPKRALSPPEEESLHLMQSANASVMPSASSGPLPKKPKPPLLNINIYSRTFSPPQSKSRMFQFATLPPNSAPPNSAPPNSDMDTG
jgi:hypothetical protein